MPSWRVPRSGCHLSYYSLLSPSVFQDAGLEPFGSRSLYRRIAWVRLLASGDHLAFGVRTQGLYEALQTEFDSFALENSTIDFADLDAEERMVCVFKGIALYLEVYQEVYQVRW